MMKLRKTLSISAILCLLLMPAMANAADAFFTDLEELPIMTGLAENQAAAVTFETANGRIIEVEASGTMKASEVMAFYGETLPQLGWTRVSDGVFERDQERLALMITDAEAGRVLVGFSLSPKPH